MPYATLMTTPHVSNVELIAQITQQYRIARNADKQRRSGVPAKA